MALGAVVHGARIEAVDLQQRRQRIGGVAIVVHHQHLHLAAVGAVGGRLWRRFARGVADHRQADFEFAAVPRAFAVRLHRAAVHLGELARQAKAYPQAAGELAGDGFALLEHAEDARDRFRFIQPDAAVAQRPPAARRRCAPLSPARCRPAA